MSNTAQIDETQLNSILAEVEAQLAVLAKSEAGLAKARPGESTSAEDKPDESTTDPTGGNTGPASASPDPASASPDASGSAPPPAASASDPDGDGDVDAGPGASAATDPDADGAGSPDASAGGDPAADQGPIDPQALMAEYSKLSPEDQKLHYMCLKQVLMQTLAGAGADDGSAPPPAGPDASAGAPPAAAPPAAASPPPDASAPAPALKGEKGMTEHVEANGQNPLHKTEADFNAAVEAKVRETMLPLVKAVKHVVEAPMRKSVQFKADLAKTEAAAPAVDVTQMSREQVRAKLAEKIQAGTLSKSEKDLVVSFEFGKVKADQIAHLLK
jgi:hypothetical protein